MSYVDNFEAQIVTDAAQFLIKQRNVGYAENDGKWVVSQLGEFYYGPGGGLRQRRPGKILGVFDTRAEAEAAIVAAEPLPEDDRMVR